MQRPIDGIRKSVQEKSRKKRACESFGRRIRDV